MPRTDPRRALGARRVPLASYEYQVTSRASCLSHEPERSRAAAQKRAASAKTATGAPRVLERRTPRILPRRPVGRPRQEGPGPVESKKHRGGGEDGRPGVLLRTRDPAERHRDSPDTPTQRRRGRANTERRKSRVLELALARRCTGSDSRAAGWCTQLPPKRPSRSTNDVESSDSGVDQARRRGARRATRDSLAERQI